MQRLGGIAKFYFVVIGLLVIFSPMTFVFMITRTKATIAMFKDFLATTIFLKC